MQNDVGIAVSKYIAAMGYQLLHIDNMREMKVCHLTKHSLFHFATVWLWEDQIQVNSLSGEVNILDLSDPSSLDRLTELLSLYSNLR